MYHAAIGMQKSIYLSGVQIALSSRHVIVSLCYSCYDVLRYLTWLTYAQAWVDPRCKKGLIDIGNEMEVYDVWHHLR